MSFLSRTVSWFALLGSGGLLMGCVVVPETAGAMPCTVLTGSMRPGLPPGTLAVVRPVDAGDIGVGDVITYQVESGRPEVVTHRVVSVGFNGGGHYVYRTKGDANEVADREPVRDVQVRGRLWYAVPYVGRTALVLDGRTRALLGSGAAGLLIGYAAVMFAGAARERHLQPSGRHRREGSR